MLPRRLPLLGTLHGRVMNDVRYALRALAGAPVFTAVVLPTLAIGIGACVSIFSVVDAVLLRPLPFPEPDRVVAIRETLPPHFPEAAVAPGKYFEWKRQARSFSSTAARANGTYNLAGDEREPERLVAVRLTANALDTFGVQPMLGRGFGPEEELPHGRNVAILGHGLWTRHFGQQPDVLHRTIQLDGHPFTVIGVMPRRSPLSDRIDVITPLVFDGDARRNFAEHNVEVFARLAPGATLASARSELSVIAQRVAAAYPPDSTGWGVKVIPMLEFQVGALRSTLITLLSAVGLLLLIACVNTANLLLARGNVRAREMAVRAAVGASPGRLRRQLLVESLLLGVGGGLLGILIALGGVRALMALAPENLPRASEVAVDGRSLVFALGLSVLTALVFGMAPGFQATRMDLNRTLTEGGRGSTGGRRRQRLQSALVIGEVALAVILLAGAGLMIRSFARLQEVKPGFQPAGVIVAGVTLPQARYPGGQQQSAFATETLRRLDALPGVKMAGLSHRIPFTGGGERLALSIAGRPASTGGDALVTVHYNVSPGYFAAMGIPLLRGRPFDERDRPDGRRVAIVNEAIVRKLFPAEDPIGKRVSVSNGPEEWREIVGVVGDVRASPVQDEIPLQTYEPFSQQPGAMQTFIVLTAGAASGVPDAIRSTIWSVDRNLPVNRIRSFVELVQVSLARQRFATVLLTVFSVVAVLLAAIGIYGVMTFWVGQRGKELAVRAALGAHLGQLFGLVLGQGGRLIGWGLLAGVAGGLLLTRFLEDMLYGVRATDPLTFAVVITMLAGVAVVACVLPARRAAKVDAVSSLRAG
jgi:putative ABC transport system permease protein